MSLDDLRLEDDIHLEIRKCLSLRDTQGGCSFNGGSSCHSCGAIPLLLKMSGNKVEHDSIEKLLKTNRTLKKLSAGGKK